MAKKAYYSHRGLVLIILLTGILRYFLKKQFEDDPEVSITELTTLGGLSTLIAEAIFQLIRGLTHPDDGSVEHVGSYFTGVLGISFIGVAISLLIAGGLKKNRIVPLLSTGLLVVFYCVYLYLRKAALI